MKTILGIDLGTSSIKLILVDETGKVIETAAKEYPLSTPRPGWAEQNPRHWIDSLRDGIQELSERNPGAVRAVAGIGVTGQMHGIVPVDRRGNVLSNAILWADRRCDEEVGELENALPMETWINITGSRPNVSFSLPKILWLRRHQPEIYQQTDFFLLPKDYIRFVLTGELATDESDASATLMYDIREKGWSKQVLDAFEIPAALLPKVHPSVAIAGGITKEAASLTGLSAGIPVVCGLGDAEAQAIGNGVASEGSWLCTIGTGGQIFTPVAEPFIDVQGRTHTLCHGKADTWHLMGATLSAGASLQWLNRQILNVRGEQSFEELMDLVPLSKTGANGLLFLPYLFGERTPHMDDKIKGAFVGLSYSHTRGDMVRAVLEGVLFSLKESIDIIHSLGIAYPEKICMTGGAAESAVWRQLAADIFGVPITRCNSRSGSAHGAVIVAAAGIGWFSTMEEAVESWIKTTETTYPDSTHHNEYKAYYSLYQQLYQHIKPVSLELDRLVKRGFG